MATFTTSIIHESVFGNKRVVTADITAVGSATATGDAYAPSTLGLRGLDIMLCVTQSLLVLLEPQLLLLILDTALHMIM